MNTHSTTKSKPTPNASEASSQSLDRSWVFDVKKDPLYSLASDYDMDFGGFVPCYTRQKFAITTEGFIALAERQYIALRCADWKFAEDISQSMFVWYLTQHLYARMIAIKAHQGDATYEEQSFSAYVQQKVHPVPQIVNHYLQSIGNVQDWTGVKYHVQFPVWPNANGNYGMVSAETHYMYETQPAPAVVAQAIVEDFCYTNDPQRDRTWDLPAGLQPSDENAGLPTKNLLGWNEATKLTQKQLELLSSYCVTKNTFITDVSQFRMNKSLFGRIAWSLNQTIRAIELPSSISDNVEGSLAQVPWQERDVSNPEEFSRSIQYLEREVRQLSPARVNHYIARPALIFAFRARKETIVDKRSYSCYDFGQYTNVPDEWHETRNAVFQFGDTYTWNDSSFRTAFRGKDDVRTAWIQKSTVVKSEN